MMAQPKFNSCETDINIERVTPGVALTVVQQPVPLRIIILTRTTRTPFSFSPAQAVDTWHDNQLVAVKTVRYETQYGEEDLQQQMDAVEDEISAHVVGCGHPCIVQVQNFTAFAKDKGAQVWRAG